MDKIIIFACLKVLLMKKLAFGAELAWRPVAHCVEVNSNRVGGTLSYRPSMLQSK